MKVQVVKLREFTGHTQAIYAVAVDQRGRFFYSAGGDRMLVRWNMDEPDGLLIGRTDSPVYAMGFNDGKLLAATSLGILHIIDTESGTNVSSVQTGSPVFRIMKYGDRMLLLLGNGKIVVLGLDYKKEMEVLVSDKPLRSVALTNDGVVVSGTDGALHFLDDKLNKVRSVQVSERTVFSMAYDMEHEMLYCGGLDAMLYGTGKNGKPEGIPAHLLHIHDLNIHPQGKLMLSSSMDKTIKLWRLPGPELIKVIDSQRFRGHTASVNKILWFDKNKFISCADDRKLMCFEVTQIQT